MPAPTILVLDNFDSFTFMLVDYLEQLGADVIVERSDSIPVGKALSIGTGGILISPGPGAPEAAGISIPLAAECVSRNHPLLGVCLGHQAIAAACGSDVVRTAPMHGKVASIVHDGTGLFEGVPTPFPATRYHSLAISDVRLPLVANAWSDDGVVMGVRHATAPVHGIQFHPESVASEQGKVLLEAFIRQCRLPA